MKITHSKHVGSISEHFSIEEDVHSPEEVKQLLTHFLSGLTAIEQEKSETENKNPQRQGA